MTIHDWPDLSRTAHALAEYDALWAAERKLLATGSYDEAEEASKRTDAAELNAKEAFALDTADRNSRDRAMLIDMNTLRCWIAEWMEMLWAACNNIATERRK